MPIILFAVGILSAAVFWYYRMQAARRGAVDLLDAANDVRLAARRFGFRRKLNVHPVDSIDDARLAASGIVHAIGTMDGALSAGQEREILVQFQSVFGVTGAEAAEIAAFGRWIAEQCGTRAEAVRRLSRRLSRIAGPEAQSDLERMIAAVVPDPGDDVADALGIVGRAFRA